MRVIFRADGSSKIGLGHVIRCCTIAGIIGDSFDCHFLIREPTPAVTEEILKYNITLEALPSDIDYISEASRLTETLTGDEIVVLDGYYFNSQYQKIIKEKGCRLVFVDDLHNSHFFADIILNHAGGISYSDYDTEFDSHLYNGPKYAIVRKEFYSDKKDSRNNKVMICFGGADPHNDTLKILSQVIESDSSSHYYVVTGKAYLHAGVLDTYIAGQATKNISHLNSLDVKALSSLMKECSAAICSPSTISYEYLSTGGELYLHQTADNQSGIYNYCINAGLAFSLTSYRKINEEMRRELLEKQQSVFDGKAPLRILSIFKAIKLLSLTQIRRARQSDLELTFNWANDPEARMMSFNTKAIIFEEHLTWFNSRLNNPNCYYYILEESGKAYAQIRFDKKEDQYLLSFSVDQLYRGKGLAPFVLTEGLKMLRKDISSKAFVVGYVKAENIASNNSFERTAFRKSRATEYKDTFKYTIEI